MNSYRWNLERKRWVWLPLPGLWCPTWSSFIELSYRGRWFAINATSFLWKFLWKFLWNFWEINFVCFWRGKHDWEEGDRRYNFSVSKRNRGLIITGFITRSIFSRNSSLETELDKKHDRTFNVTLSLRKYRSRRRNLKLLPNCHSKPIGSLFDRDRIELIVRIFSSNLFRSPPMREIINDNIFGFIDGTASEKKGMENVHVDWNICKCNKSDTRWKRMYT